MLAMRLQPSSTVSNILILSLNAARKLENFRIKSRFCDKFSMCFHTTNITATARIENLFWLATKDGSAIVSVYVIHLQRALLREKSETQ
jgi:hypothetical protein